MIINNGSHLHRDLVRGFPISTIISNIDVVQIGLPAFGYYGNKDTKPGTPVMEIEAGSHEDPASFARAITCSLALLQNLEMISRDTDSLDGVVTEYREYQVFGSVVFPNDSYRVVRCFKDFERVAAGTVFAKGNGAPLVAERDCLTLFCPDENRIPDWKLTQEEAMYLLDL